MKKLKKPPIGIRPQWLALEDYNTKRIAEISNAVKRYLEKNAKIPLDWIIEYNELTNKLK